MFNLSTDDKIYISLSSRVISKDTIQDFLNLYSYILNYTPTEECLKYISKSSNHCLILTKLVSCMNGRFNVSLLETLQRMYYQFEEIKQNKVLVIILLMVWSVDDNNNILDNVYFGNIVNEAIEILSCLTNNKEILDFFISRMLVLVTKSKPDFEMSSENKKFMDNLGPLSTASLIYYNNFY